MSSIQLAEEPVKSGDEIKISGYYLLGKHDHPSSEKCNILKSEERMFFTKGSLAPRPLSCQHKVRWWLAIVK